MVDGKDMNEQTAVGRIPDAVTDAERQVDWGRLDAVLVDLDGVVTETAKVHARAWKRTFDDYLREHAARRGGAYHPFDLGKDYKIYVDGKPRYDGVASFLQSREIYLPRGEESDQPDKETICGLGNRKNEHYQASIREYGVEVYSSSIAFIRCVRSIGRKIAVVTSSRNCDEVLEAAGIADLFDAQVDGNVAREWFLDGKPAPDTYLEAAHRLGVDPSRACIIEDAVSGVQAGKAGKFGLVIGVSRDGEPGILRQCGADIVVSDLSEVDIGCNEAESGTIAPLALEHLRELKANVRNRRAVVFLDYDGTLTPIVNRPEDAVLSDDMRATVRELAATCPVVIITGRVLADIQEMVGLDGITYAGSHGFDIAGQRGGRTQHKVGAEYVPIIAQAAQDIRDRLKPIKGALVEDKIYNVAVHYRMVRKEEVARVERAVDAVLAKHPGLRKSAGKKVFELRPEIDWGKGKAVLWLLQALELEASDVVPIYLGDDVTDRDAFNALRGRGISILVADDAQATTADYRLANPAEVRLFLSQLTGALQGRGA